MSATEIIESLPVPPAPPGLHRRLGKKFCDDPSAFENDSIFGRYKRKFGPELQRHANAYAKTEGSIPSGITGKAREVLLSLKRTIAKGSALMGGGSAVEAPTAPVQALSDVEAVGVAHVAVQSPVAVPMAPAPPAAPVVAAAPAVPVPTPVLRVKPQGITPEQLGARMEEFEPGSVFRYNYEVSRCRTDAERESVMDETVARLVSCGFTMTPRVLPAGTIDRNTFDLMGDRERSLFFIKGGKLVD